MIRAFVVILVLISAGVADAATCGDVFEDRGVAEAKAREFRRIHILQARLIATEAKRLRETAMTEFEGYITSQAQLSEMKIGRTLDVASSYFERERYIEEHVIPTLESFSAQSVTNRGFASLAEGRTMLVELLATVREKHAWRFPRRAYELMLRVANGMVPGVSYTAWISNPSVGTELGIDEAIRSDVIPKMARHIVTTAATSSYEATLAHFFDPRTEIAIETLREQLRIVDAFRSKRGIDLYFREARAAGER